MQPLYFVSSNPYKVSEYSRIFQKHSIDITPVDIDFAELQSIDPIEIVRDKVVRAYARFRRPVIVEHSGISLAVLSGLPMGLTKPFWLILKDHICQIANGLNQTDAELIVCMSFCDGETCATIKESVHGQINAHPVPGSFHLDRVFVPNGAADALASMTDAERDNWSPRPKAVSSLIGKRLGDFIREQRLL